MTSVGQGSEHRRLLVDIGAPLRHRTKGATEFEALERYPCPVMVWAYGPVRKGKVMGHQPEVKLHLRLVHGDAVGEFVVHSEGIGITSLGALRVGSVWDGGRLVGDRRFEVRHLPVNFAAYDLVTPNQAALARSVDRHLGGEITALSAQDHPLPRQFEGWLLRYTTQEYRFLYVPCLEELVRRYGRSGEVKRVLTTYDSETAWKRLLTSPEYTALPRSGGRWPITPGIGTYNDDEVFLGHLAYDEVTRRAVKRLAAQFEVAVADTTVGATSRDRPWTALQVLPWHGGEGMLKVAGVEINGGQDFLGLRIIGSTEARGGDIVSSRPRAAGFSVNDGDETDAGDGGRAVVHRKRPEHVSVVQGEEPHLGGNTVSVTEEEFEILDDRRQVFRIRRGDNGPVPYRRHVNVERSRVSTEEKRGRGGDVDRASILSPSVPLNGQGSPGVVREMWTALGVVARVLGLNVPQSVVMNGRRLTKSMTLALSSLAPPPGAERGPAWAYLIPGSTTPRELLLAHLKVGTIDVWLVEVTRRQRRGRADAPETMERTGEECFKGLLVVTGRMNFEMARSLADAIVAKEGVMRSAGEAFLRGEIAQRLGVTRTLTFTHQKHADERVPYTTLLVKQLIEIGVATVDDLKRMPRKLQADSDGST